MIRGRYLKTDCRTAATVVVLLSWFLLDAARAEVSRIDITSREDVLMGRSFGVAGAYEKLKGTISFTLDPKDPDNSAIVGIDLAPQNDEGLVEFASDFYVLKPKDPSRGNRAMLFGVVNRGNKYLLRYFNRAAPKWDHWCPN